MSNHVSIYEKPKMVFLDTIDNHCAISLWQSSNHWKTPARLDEVFDMSSKCRCDL